jgi:sensor histidine kinase YesM
LRCSARILDDFLGPGSRAAWLAAALAVSAMAVFARGSPLLVNFLLMLSSYALAHAMLWFARSRLPWPLELWKVFALAIGATVSSALLVALGVQGVVDFFGDAGTLAPRLAIASVFTGACVLPRILLRASEEGRRAKEEERHARELEQESHLKQLAQMRLMALQAQIEPHFLFNTLANVQHLVRTSPAAADEMLGSFIRYLKSAVPQMRAGTSTVGEEVARVEAYLAIMRVRMGERLRYRVDVPREVHDLPLPPLSLVTLVENSVKHGLEGKPAGGMIRVEGCVDEGVLKLRVIDDGLGFKDDLGSGIGLTNLRERIAAIHGDHATLDLAMREPCGVEATLSIPLGVHERG